MDRENSDSHPYLFSALTVLRESAAEINRLSAENTTADALRLIADTAVRLVDQNDGDEPATVIYAYDPERAAFDPASRTRRRRAREPTGRRFPPPRRNGRAGDPPPEADAFL